jgi:uncharacterized membrane protein
VGGVIVALLRRWLRKPRWILLSLLILPIVVDGTTHMISDWWGVGQGFRYSNRWLANLTGGILPVSFYVGNAFGSFNWWMRLVTGLLAGLGITWVLYPPVDEAFREIGRKVTNV